MLRSLFAGIALFLIRHQTCFANDSDILEILSEILPGPEQLNVTVVPHLCRFSRVPNQGAFTVASYDSFDAGYFPHRVLIVICDLDAEFISLWEYLYIKYIRFYGIHYFSVLDLTRGPSLLDFATSAVVPGPFSYLRYDPEGNRFLLFVDSDFRGARKPWTRFEVTRGDIQREPLFSKMFYDKFRHDGEMRVQMTTEDNALRVDVIPKYTTNYSEQGEIVYSSRSGIARSTVKSHWTAFVPLLLENHVAVYMNPKRADNNYLLMSPWPPIIWVFMIVSSAAIAIIMTWSLPKSVTRSRAVFLAENLSLAFCQMFTSLKLPSGKRFLHVSAAVTSVAWALLCIIPLAGYRSTLAALLRTPPRGVKHEVANVDWKLGDKLVCRRRPGITDFLAQLRQGEFWVEGSSSINFLLTQWGLQQSTYIVPLHPPSFGMYSFQCLHRKAQNFIYACRSTQKQMRILFDNNALMPWLNKIERDHLRNPSPLRPSQQMNVKGAMYRNGYGDDDIVALELRVAKPFFALIALGVLLASTLLSLELFVDAVSKRVNARRRDRKVLLLGLWRILSERWTGGTTLPKEPRRPSSLSPAHSIDEDIDTCTPRAVVTVVTL